MNFPEMLSWRENGLFLNPLTNRQMDITSQLGWVGKLGVSGQLNS